MPQYQRQLGHLLPLLAQFQQRRLACFWPQELRDPLQDSPVVFADSLISGGHGWSVVSHGHASADARHGAVVVVVGCYAVVMLLLGCGGGGRCGLSLGVLLGGVVGVLLMVGRPVGGGVLVLVGEDVPLGHHGCGEGAGPVLINGEHGQWVKAGCLQVREVGCGAASLTQLVGARGAAALGKVRLKGCGCQRGAQTNRACRAAGEDWSSSCRYQL